MIVNTKNVGEYRLTKNSLSKQRKFVLFVFLTCGFTRPLISSSLLGVGRQLRFDVLCAIN